MTVSDELVARKIEVWKGRLLDVSNRNPLIRFRRTKSSVLTIDSPDAFTLFKELTSGRKYTVAYDPLVEEKRGTGILLVSAQDPDQPVERVLYNLRGRSRTYRNDHGVNVLFVAMGILVWKEGSGDLNESPLFLLPVTLERSNSFSPYILLPLDEEPVLNPCLRKRLEMEYRLKLPDLELENGSDLRQALEAVKESIPSSSGWHVHDISHIALFQFSKLLMYSDLELGTSSLASNPVIRALAGEPSALLRGPIGPPRPQDSETSSRPEDGFQVLDADSSQLEAVQMALSGTSFVLQGPPGTGKSQTITNMIAELMARGKRVLFVSQKMASLDVVRGNLERCGLGDYCLELHDPKKGRAEIVKEIAASLERRVGSQRAATDFREWASVHKQLNDYVRCLHAPRGRLGTDVYTMIGKYAELCGAPELRFGLPDVLQVDEERLSRMEGMVLRLSQMTGALRDPSHPWCGALVTEWSDRLQAKVQEELLSLMDARRDLYDSLPALSSALGLEQPTSLPEVRRLRQLYRDLADRPRVKREWLERDLSTMVALTRDGLSSYHEVLDKEKGLQGIGSRDILDIDAKLFRQRFDVEYSGPLRALKGGYRRDMRILRLASGRKLRYEEASRLVRSVEEYQRCLAAWKAKREQLMSVLHGAFSGDGEELPGILERMEWTLRFRSAHALLLNNKVIDDLCSESVPDHVKDGAIDLESRSGRFERALDSFAARFKQDFGLGGRPLKDSDLRQLEAWTDRLWESRSRYREWMDLTALLDGMEALGLGELVDELRSRPIPPEGFVSGFQRRFRRLWIENALDSDPVLKRFRREHQESLIARFEQLDIDLLESGRWRLRCRLEENLRRRREGKERELLFKQETEMLRLSRLKRQRKAVRTMLNDCWELIGLLKPCMLMSPLSVAQFLDRDRTLFDTVIFDEASQICPEDAIGSIVRGRQVIVVGDGKQMPPTSFFSLTNDEDEEPDLESILDECETCGMPRLMLTWHYRSKDESLIAFSNHHFYGGRLNTFPSPIFGREGSGLHHVFVPNGVFDRGRTRTNREEARAVARMVREHYSRKDWGSLGVIAFSEAQMEAIDEELDRLRKEDRTLDEILSSEEGEPFLLYNLENVQGHERDRVILSVGYGRDEAGRFLLNFGPLNKEGGERRLNVAITRARSRLDVVSSIRSADIDLSGSHSNGARLLKQFLAFAESGGDPTALPVQESKRLDAESPFEEHLFRELRSRGHKVRMNVGTSDVRVDLAIEDPAEGGNMLLGILCDGPHYISCRTVRDRERTRPAQLKRMGWNLIRVWSVEWFRDPLGELERIEEALRSRSKG